MSNAAETMHRVIEATASPYPASFDGSTFRFGFALFSLMSITVMAAMIWTWMIREIWENRDQAYPWEPIFALRVIFVAFTTAALLRSAPEVAYMIAYRESDPSTISSILAFKRWCDGSTLFPAMTWMGMIWLFYLPICGQMIAIRKVEGPQLSPRVSKPQIKRMLSALALTFSISALIAIGKR